MNERRFSLRMAAIKLSMVLGVVVALWVPLGFHAYRNVAAHPVAPTLSERRVVDAFYDKLSFQWTYDSEKGLVYYPRRPQCRDELILVLESLDPE